jgi:pimeloyl-ACP methyl ester carboxylesterase
MKSEIKKLSWLLLFLIGSLIWNGCDENDPGLAIKQKLWISSDEYIPSTSVTASAVKSIVGALGLVDPTNAEKYNSLANLVKYDLKFYRVKYKTLFRGDSVNASGLICVPVAIEKKESFPMMCYQHSAIAKKSEAPSVSPLFEGNALIAYLASTGMIILMPDYIGFGESQHYFHPFLHKEYTSHAVLDFIRAGKEFIGLKNPAKWNDKLFLAGYSQGGSATLAALSAIENNSANADIVVTATSCGAGAYNLTAFRDWIVNRMNYEGRYEQPWYLAYLLESFTKYAGVTTPYNSIFKEDISPLVNGAIDGNKTGAEINSLFPQYLGSLLHPDFMDNTTYQSNEVYFTLKTALTENSIAAWPLKSKLTLYYGQNDVWIPAQLSLSMIGEFQAAGSATNLRSVQFPGLNHVTAFPSSILGTLEWFRTF